MNAAVLDRPPAPAESPLAEERSQAAERVAVEMFRQEPDWVTFFREVLGVEGLVRKLFATPAELAAFEQTAEYAHIQQMLVRLRERGLIAAQEKECTRVITVRLPKSLHISLLNEAHRHETSLNQLCISKLLHVLGDELLPAPLPTQEAL